VTFGPLLFIPFPIGSSPGQSRSASAFVTTTAPVPASTSRHSGARPCTGMPSAAKKPGVTRGTWTHGASSSGPYGRPSRKTTAQPAPMSRSGIPVAAPTSRTPGSAASRD
jgi:hypothetical protein